MYPDRALGHPRCIRQRCGSSQITMLVCQMYTGTLAYIAARFQSTCCGACPRCRGNFLYTPISLQTLVEPCLGQGGDTGQATASCIAVPIIYRKCSGENINFLIVFRIHKEMLCSNYKVILKG